jgi:plasmid stabilization system protein ParE
MKLEPELRAAFMAEAEAAHRPASQVLRELMREFVQLQRQTREYDEFLGNKVAAARASMLAGVGHSSDNVEAIFATRRATVAKTEVRVVWTPEALQDRADVWDYIVADNPQAVRMDELFSDAAARLADHPELGRQGKIQGTRESAARRCGC